ncbi:MAG: hypothetical protein CL981_06230 [Euryarchaeota archaeon]|nr:hypothetical protein [Euryarchaeota archaeon]
MVDPRSRRETDMSAAFGRGTKCARLESVVEDLKPVDLFLARLKPGESWVEDRTVADVQIARRSWV